MNDLSRGRAVLGLNGGLEQPELWPHERSHPFKAVPDAVEISRGMFRGETVSHAGRVISVERAKLSIPPFRPGLAVVIAARGKRMIDVTGELTVSCISPRSF